MVASWATPAGLLEGLTGRAVDAHEEGAGG